MLNFCHNAEQQSNKFLALNIAYWHCKIPTKIWMQVELELNIFNYATYNLKSDENQIVIYEFLYIIFM